MFLTILGFGVLLFIIAGVCALAQKEDAAWVLLVFGIIFFLIGGLHIIFMVPSIGTAELLDAEIAMHQEENARIEAQLAAAIEQFMEHESETFVQVKGDSVISLVTLYPEIKSDKLIQELVDVYLENSDLIRELKKDQIDIYRLKWLVYFG